MQKTKHTQFGVTSMGEKGQVVIPADIRTALGFAKGEKLLVIAKGGYVSLVSASRFESMTERFSAIRELFSNKRK